MCINNSHPILHPLIYRLVHLCCKSVVERMTLEELKEVLPEDLFSICLQNHKNRLQYLAKQHSTSTSPTPTTTPAIAVAVATTTITTSSSSTSSSSSTNTFGSVIESWWHRLFQWRETRYILNIHTYHRIDSRPRNTNSWLVDLDSGDRTFHIVKPVFEDRRTRYLLLLPVYDLEDLDLELLVFPTIVLRLCSLMSTWSPS